VVEISNESTILLSLYPVSKIDGETLWAVPAVKDPKEFDCEKLTFTF